MFALKFIYTVVWVIILCLISVPYIGNLFPGKPDPAGEATIVIMLAGALAIEIYGGFILMSIALFKNIQVSFKTLSFPAWGFATISLGIIIYIGTPNLFSLAMYLMGIQNHL
jgi:hypothetical protein